jgi:hypothetical protein
VRLASARGRPTITIGHLVAMRNLTRGGHDHVSASAVVDRSRPPVNRGPWRWVDIVSPGMATRGAATSAARDPCDGQQLPRAFALVQRRRDGPHARRDWRPRLVRTAATLGAPMVRDMSDSCPTTQRGATSAARMLMHSPSGLPGCAQGAPRVLAKISISAGFVAGGTP